MKNIILLLTFVLVFVPILASAQTQTLYVHKVQTEFASYKSNETIKGAFNISNLSTEKTEDIYYRVFVVDKLKKGINFEDSSEKLGPITLNPESTQELKYEYQLSGQTTGNIDIGIVLERDNETPVTWYTVPIFVEKVEKEQVEETNNNLGLIPIILLLILILIFALAFKKLYGKHALVALFATSTILFGLSSVITTDVYAQSSGCLTINGIGSPVSQSVRDYSPGEQFFLEFSLGMNNCTKDANYKVFAPGAGSGWINDNQSSIISNNNHIYYQTRTSGEAGYAPNGTFVPNGSSALSANFTGGSSDPVNMTGNFMFGPYTVPDNPGIHTFPFYTEKRSPTNLTEEVLGQINICIKGSGTCTSENAPTGDICPNLLGDQSEIPNGHFIDSSGNCVISQLSCNSTPNTASPNQQVVFESSIRYSGGENDINFCWDGGNCSRNGVDKLNNGTIFSNFTKSFPTTGTYSFPISATIDAPNLNICSVGDVTCDQQYTVFDPTGEISRDTGYNFEWTCAGCGIKNSTVTYKAPAYGSANEALQACKAVGYQELVSFGTTDHSGWYRQGEESILTEPILTAISTYDPTTDTWTSKQGLAGDPVLDYNSVICTKPVGCTDCLCESGGPCTQTTTVLSSGTRVVDKLTNTDLLPFTGGHSSLRGVYPSARADDQTATEICRLLGYSQMNGYTTGSYGSPSDNTLVTFRNGVWEVGGAIALDNRYIGSNSLTCSKPIVHNINNTQPQIYNSFCTIEIVDSPISCSVTNPNPGTGENVTFTAQTTDPGIDLDNDTICWDGNCAGTGLNKTFSTSFSNTGSNFVNLSITNSSGTTYGPTQCSVNVTDVFTASCSPANNQTGLSSGDSVSYSASATDPSTYTWSSDPGVSISNYSGPNDSDITATFNNSGDVTVTATRISDGRTSSANCGSGIISSTNNLTVSCIPPSGNLFNNVDLDFKSNVSGENGSVNYSWSTSPNGTITGSGSSVKVSFATPGDKTVTVTATDSNGSKSDSCNLTIGDGAGVPPTVEFRLQSPFADSNLNRCRYSLATTNAQVCHVNLGDPIRQKGTPGVNFGFNPINGNNVSNTVDPGSHTVTCVSPDGLTATDGPRRCIGNIDIIED